MYHITVCDIATNTTKVYMGYMGYRIISYRNTVWAKEMLATSTSSLDIICHVSTSATVSTRCDMRMYM